MLAPLDQAGTAELIFSTGGIVPFVAKDFWQHGNGAIDRAAQGRRGSCRSQLWVLAVENTIARRSRKCRGS